MGASAHLNVPQALDDDVEEAVVLAHAVQQASARHSGLQGGGVMQGRWRVHQASARHSGLQGGGIMQGRWRVSHTGGTIYIEGMRGSDCRQPNQRLAGQGAGWG